MIFHGGIEQSIKGLEELGKLLKLESDADESPHDDIKKHKAKKAREAYEDSLTPLQKSMREGLREMFGAHPEEEMER